MYRVTDVGSVVRLLLRSNGRAERISLARWRLDDAGKCSDPVSIELTGRDFIDRPGQSAHAVLVDHLVPCRKCRACMEARGREWRARALAECVVAPRTWFVTLTFTPHEQAMAVYRARARLRKRAVSFDDLSEDQRYSERHLELGKLITKYLKRLRKSGKTRFRYIVVAEKHRSGDPHYHLLVHEVAGEEPLRHALLSQKWPHGWGTWKLIRSLAVARYVTKYLSKSVLARVRASTRYGRIEQLQEACANAGAMSISDQSVQTLSEFIQDIGVWVGSEVVRAEGAEREATTLGLQTRKVSTPPTPPPKINGGRRSVLFSDEVRGSAQYGVEL